MQRGTYSRDKNRSVVDESRSNAEGGLSSSGFDREEDGYMHKRSIQPETFSSERRRSLSLSWTA